MPSAAQVIELNAHRRSAVPADWDRLAMLNSSLCPRDAVTMYARLGLRPILVHGVTGDSTCTCGRPDCTSVGKHPVAKGWQSAPFNVAELDATLTERWNLNVGLQMGMQPGGFRLVAIDVDGPRSLLADLEAKHGRLPPTLTATSGKGTHLIYRLRDDAATPKNMVRLAPGVDVRSEKGQIVCAPSRHVSGRRYRWLEAREPAVLP